VAVIHAVYLRLRGPFRVGERGVGMEGALATVPSDTLFSALTMAVRLSDGAADTARWLEPFRAGAPPFLLSSTFPVVTDGDGRRWRCLPRPRLPLNRRGATDEGAAVAPKALKRLTWVGEDLFRRLIAGEAVFPDLQRGAIWDAEQVWWGAAAPPHPDDGPLWTRPEPVARVALDRASVRSQLFRSARVFYRSIGVLRAGLYVLVRFNDERWRERFERALFVLGELGIGSERSIGHGQFQIEGWEALTFADQGPYVVVLSFYAPTPSEHAAGVFREARVELSPRRGWVTSPEGAGWLRAQVTMVAPGSVVRRVGETLGQLVDVTPRDFTAHPVYRYGYALAVPCVDPATLE
jgi:CRISPR-associated protein Csm4